MDLTPGLSYNGLKKAENTFYHPSLLNRTSIHNGVKDVSSGPHTLKTKSLKHHLSQGSMSLLTAHNPGAKKLSPHENASRNAHLESDLKSMGAVYHHVKGKYSGNHEDSFMVHHTKSVSPGALSNLAAKHGQESILHTSKGQHKLQYVTGDHAGKYHPGQGHVMNTKSKDNFSHVADRPKDKFTLGINFNRLDKSAGAKKHKVMTGFEIECEGEVHTVDFNIDYSKLLNDSD